jgi:hypothetical protein
MTNPLVREHELADSMLEPLLAGDAVPSLTSAKANR